MFPVQLFKVNYSDSDTTDFVYKLAQAMTIEKIFAQLLNYWTKNHYRLLLEQSLLLRLRLRLLDFFFKWAGGYNSCFGSWQFDPRTIERFCQSSFSI